MTENHLGFEFTRLVHFYHAIRTISVVLLSVSFSLKMWIYFPGWSYNLVREKRPYPSLMTGNPLDSLDSRPFSKGAKCSVTYMGYREAFNFSALRFLRSGLLLNAARVSYYHGLQNVTDLRCCCY